MKTNDIIKTLPESMLESSRAKLVKIGEQIGKTIEKAHVSRAAVIQPLLDHARTAGIGRKPFIEDVWSKVFLPARDGGAFPELGESALRNYKTSLGIAFDYGVPFRAGLFNDPKYRKQKPKAETESLEVGEGLAADTKAGKKPKPVQTLTRASVVGQAAALVHALTQVGETDAAEEIRGVLQDYNLWAIPKAVN